MVIAHHSSQAGRTASAQAGFETPLIHAKFIQPIWRASNNEVEAEAKELQLVDPGKLHGAYACQL